MSLLLFEGRLYYMTDDESPSRQWRTLFCILLLSCRWIQDLWWALHSGDGASSQEAASATCPAASGLLWSTALGFLHSASAYHLHPLPTFLHPCISHTPAAPRPHISSLHTSMSLCLHNPASPTILTLYLHTPISLYPYSSVCLYPHMPAYLHLYTPISAYPHPCTSASLLPHISASPHIHISACPHPCITTFPHPGILCIPLSHLPC